MSHIKAFISLLFLLGFFCINSNCISKIEDVENALQDKVVSAPISHELWNHILNRNVSPEGFVNYTAIQSNKIFKTYLDLLSTNHPNESWNRNEQLAFWINAYNAFTVKLILDHWPVESIKDINSPWKQPFIEIGERIYSLNDIEHNILRKKFDEPRIHFAINCASYSCPKLVRYAFEASKLNTQLENVTRAFINDSVRNSISSEVIQISRLFDWFKGDFTKSGSLQDFIKNYTTTKINNATKIEYLEYNWSLNGQNN